MTDTVKLPVEMDEQYLEGACFLFAMKANPSLFAGTWHHMTDEEKEVVREIVKLSHGIFLEMSESL